MMSRAFALLLALVLLWSGFTSPAAPAWATADFAQAATQPQVEPAPGTPDGPADKPHLGDLSTPGHAETVTDTQALLTARAAAPALSLQMARPWPAAALTRLSPYLDGPQRPPRDGAPRA